MRVAIVAVGTELLGAERVDTNSLRLTEVLRRYGMELVGKSVVGDSFERIADWVGVWLERVDLLLVTGGLGPTSDDMTREAVAHALDLELIEDPRILEDIRRKFKSFDREMPPSNRRQAAVPVGAAALDNPRGTAPGLQLSTSGTTVFLFPGVPSELESMIRAYLEPWLAKRSGGRRIASRSVRLAGRSESSVEEALTPLYEEFGVETITVLASPGDIEVRFTARGTGPGNEAKLGSMVARARHVLGRAVYAEESDVTLEEVVGALLSASAETVATAESCTAGLLSERLTRIPGSREYFAGGIVTYSDQLKIDLLDVASDLLELHGAVSEEVARAMAGGVRRRLNCDYGIAITGIAGPGGGSEGRPVGTVHIALDGRGITEKYSHRLLHLPGERLGIRQLATQWALEMFRQALVACR